MPGKPLFRNEARVVKESEERCCECRHLVPAGSWRWNIFFTRHSTRNTHVYTRQANICFPCHDDWAELLTIIKTSAVCGTLEAKIQAAVQGGWLSGSHRLAIKWRPERSEPPRPTLADGQLNLPLK